MAIASAIVGGLIAGAGAIGAAAIGNKGASNAAKAQQQTAADNNALQQQIYNQNAQTLAPYVQTGNSAMGALNSFLGLPSAGQATYQSPGYGPGYGQTVPGSGVGRGPNDAYDIAATFNRTGQYPTNDILRGPLQGQGFRQYSAWANGQNPNQQYMAGNTTPAPQISPQSQNAFRNYIENSDYGFQFGQGANKVNSGYAGAGSLKSGAAMKALEDYRQGLQSGYRNEYLGYLGQQQGVGLSAAGAQAGVGVNYANSVSQNNQNAANAISNAALIKAQNTGNALGTIGAIGANLFGRGI